MIGERNRLVIFILFLMFLHACSPKVSQVQSPLSFPPSEIQNIRVTQGPQKMEVVVEGQQPMIYTTFHLDDPFRLIIDMAGIGLGNFKDKIMVDQGPIRSILPKSGDGNQVSRLEIELSESVDTNVRTEGTNLIVEVTHPVPKEGADAQTVENEEEPQKPAEEPKAILPPPIKEEENVPPAKTIKNVRFDRKDGLQLVVTADGLLAPHVFLVGKDRLVIDLPNVKMTMKAKSIPAEDRAVKQVRIGRYPDKVRLVLDLSAPVAYSLRQSENQLYVDLPPLRAEAQGDGLKVSQPPSETKTPTSSAPLVEAPPVETEAAPVSPPTETLTEQKPESAPAPQETAKVEAPKMEDGAGEVADNAALALDNGTSPENEKKDKNKEKKDKDEESPPPRYVGRRISLDFQDADITNVIRLIADVSRLNIVLGEDIKGKVTLKLVNVPWDQALDIILKMNSLGQIRDGNIIRVATLANITRQQDEEAKAKETKLKAEDISTRVLYVNYSKARDLAEPLKKLLSTRGDITVDDRTNTMIVKDTDKNIVDIAHLVKTLDTQTPQVVIEARIVQVAPTFNRSLGIKWGANYSDSSNGNLIGINNPSSASAFGTPTPDFAVNLPAASPFGGVGFSFGRFTSNPFNLDLRLSAGESQGLTRIVSTPKISVLDNQEAKIEQGESIPFQVSSPQQGIQTSFIDANLTLLVTPHISSDGGVIMKIKITKNAPGEQRQGASGPSILKKEATTNILVRDGETTVIGGIYETTKSDSVSGIPWLMDIPVLGWFFKTSTKREDTSELLVFLTPRILK